MRLTPKISEEYVKAKDTFYETRGKIEDRIDEVLHLLCDFFDAKLVAWWFPDAREGEVGTMRIDFTDKDDCLELVWEGTGLSELESQLHGGLPTQFLFMDDDDILKSIRQDIAAEEARKKKRKEVAKKSRVEKENAKKSAMSKLTKEEIKSLGIK